MKESFFISEKLLVPNELLPSGEFFPLKVVPPNRGVIQMSGCDDTNITRGLSLGQ